MYAILTAAVAALMLGTTGGMNAATAVPAAVHASGTEQKQEPAPELSFDRMEHDFGTLRFKGEPQTPVRPRSSSPAPNRAAPASR